MQTEVLTFQKLSHKSSSKRFYNLLEKLLIIFDIVQQEALLILLLWFQKHELSQEFFMLQTNQYCLIQEKSLI